MALTNFLNLHLYFSVRMHQGIYTIVLGEYLLRRFKHQVFLIIVSLLLLNCFSVLSVSLFVCCNCL